MRILSILALIATMLSYPASAQRYSITDLGNISGGGGIAIWDLNESGVAVGSVDSDLIGQTVALVLNRGFVNALSPPSMLAAGATGINNLGHVTGGSVDYNGRYYGFILKEGNYEFFGENSTQAADINDYGYVTGYSLDQGFIYKNGILNFINIPDSLSSVGLSINNEGQVAGYATFRLPNYEAFSRAFLYQDGSIEMLGTLGGEDSWAYAINSIGTIVGASNDQFGKTMPFVFQNGIMASLGIRGSTYDVNVHGHVVGYSQEENIGQPFIYKHGSIYNLKDLIESNSGWHLIDATAINDSGQIVGTGTHNGMLKAYLLSPISSAVPEPASWMIFILGFCSVGFVARYHRRQTDRGSAHTCYN